MQTDTGKSIMSLTLSLIGAAGIGATIMYFLDPDRGRRRRHLVSDQLVHAGHVAGDALRITKRDLANRAHGVTASVRSRFEGDGADDRIITERVRAELGRAVSHPSAIEVSVDAGEVTLHGPVLAREADALVARVRRVRGVTGVVNDLEPHEQAEGVPGLPGAARAPGGNHFEPGQENWTPAGRLLTGVAGGALTWYALSGEHRRGLAGPLLGLTGAALLARGATNKPFRQLVGIGGAGR